MTVVVAQVSFEHVTSLETLSVSWPTTPVRPIRPSAMLSVFALNRSTVASNRC